jgi:quercetin dioxygenase-like cupin family protein
MRSRISSAALLAGIALSISTPMWLAQPHKVVAQAATPATFNIATVVEKKVTQIPDGPLYWQLETFPTLAQAQAAVGPTGLAASVEGKFWLFTLGPKGAASHGGTNVAEVWPVTRIAAPEYLLRVNNAVAQPGTKTAIHTHPGTEAFYILSGALSQKTPQSTISLEAGQSTPGRGPDTAMEVSSTGNTELHALVTFLVDAAKPFSTPAQF